MNEHYHGKALMNLLIQHEVPFAEGCIMKYVFRWREKGGIRDLNCALDYLQDLIAHEKKKPTLSKEPF